MTKKQLSPIYWLWIPIVAMCFQIILELILPGNILSHLHSENGPHELIEFFLLVIGFFVSVNFLFHSKNKPHFLKMWFGLAAICCFYVAGEEISWGQHIWDWATPDFWTEVNDQQETNLHNTSSWFDQKPRLILILGIVFGTLVAPVLKKHNCLKLPSKLDQLLPSKKLSIIAFLILIPHLLEKVLEVFGHTFFARFSEVQELYIFYFVLLYLVILKNKTHVNE